MEGPHGPEASSLQYEALEGCPVSRRRGSLSREQVKRLTLLTAPPLAGAVLTIVALSGPGIEACGRKGDVQ